MLKKTLLSLTIIILFSSSPLHATPDRSVHIREILLGTNETSYFSLVMIWQHPGSHYKATESVALRQYSLKDEKLIEETMIRETDYEEDSNRPEKVSKTEKLQAGFDLNKYLLDHGITYAFPHPELDPKKLMLNKKGIVLKGKRAKLIKSLKDIKHSLPWYDEDTIISGLFESGDYVFALLETGKVYADLDFHQGLTILKIE